MPMVLGTRVRRSLIAAFILGLVALFTAVSVDESSARLGGGGSFGSRGARTYSMPSSPAPSMSGQGYGYGQRGGFMSGGLGRGFLGGLLGAGLFGMLFGGGFGGGLGGLSSLLGLLIQVGLLFLLFRFVMSFFGGRPLAFGGGGGGFGQMPFRNGFGTPGSRPANAPVSTPITVEGADYAVFEQRLAAMQALYSDENVAGLSRLATPEMVSHFASDLAANNSRGLVNKLSDVRLVQGNLSEAWREGGSEYATVSMQFSLIDTMVERASGHIVGGNTNVPQTVTELWTFVRPVGSGPNGWILSSIQQA